MFTDIIPIAVKTNHTGEIYILWPSHSTTLTKDPAMYNSETFAVFCLVASHHLHKEILQSVMSVD